jgi:hypothetical protein
MGEVNEQIVGFEKRFGIQPNGFLINPITWFRIYQELLTNSNAQEVPDDKYLGIKVYRSPDISEGIVKFVI